MRLQLIFCLLLYFLEVSLLGIYLKDLLILVVLLKSFLMILMMVQLIQLDLFALSLANGFKEALSGGSPQTNLGFPFCFYSVFSGLDDCYYCSNIIVSLLFKLCAKFSLRLQERSKVCTCCPKTYSVCLTEKFGINHQIIFLI